MLKIKFLFLFFVTIVTAREYRLESLKTRDFSLSAKQNITLGFEEDRVFGFNGCNRFFGNIIKNQISNLGNTMMMCPQEDMEIERVVMGILKNASIEISTHQVIVKNASGMIVFVAK